MNTEIERTAQLRRMTRRPSTPGKMIADHLDEMGLTQGALAEAVDVSRATINRLIQGHHRLTPDLAQRVARFFGGSPEFWLRVQANVDQWDAMHMDTTPYEHIQQWNAA